MEQHNIKEAFLAYQKGGKLSYDEKTKEYSVITSEDAVIPISEEVFNTLNKVDEMSFKYELKDLEEQIEKIYERKNAIYKEYLNSEFGIMSPESRGELDELIHQEAKLVSRHEDLSLLNHVSPDPIQQTMDAMPKEEDKVHEEMQPVLDDNIDSNPTLDEIEAIRNEISIDDRETTLDEDIDREDEPER